MHGHLSYHLSYKLYLISLLGLSTLAHTGGNVNSSKLFYSVYFLNTSVIFPLRPVCNKNSTDHFVFFYFITEHLPEDDSDMLMEPNEFRETSVIPSQPHGYFHTSEFRTIAPEYVHLDRSQTREARSEESQPTQNHYPSPPHYRNVYPLGHSRPYYSVYDPQSRRANYRSAEQSILGSGEFGVIRGGTFYPEGEEPDADYHPVQKPYGDAFNDNRWQFASDLDKRFADFRDFADINTPRDPAFSQLTAVYANKNSTDPFPYPNPKNIFEQLQLLDKEVKEEERQQKKNTISKFKKKLASTKLEKKYKKKLGPKESSGDYEPLLALS